MHSRQWPMSHRRRGERSTPAEADDFHRRKVTPPRQSHRPEHVHRAVRSMQGIAIHRMPIMPVRHNGKGGDRSFIFAPQVDTMAAPDAHTVAHTKGGGHHPRPGPVEGVAVPPAHRTGSARVGGARDGWVRMQRVPVHQSVKEEDPGALP